MSGNQGPVLGPTLEPGTTVHLEPQPHELPARGSDRRASPEELIAWALRQDEGN